MTENPLHQKAEELGIATTYPVILRLYYWEGATGREWLRTLSEFMEKYPDQEGRVEAKYQYTSPCEKGLMEIDVIVNKSKSDFELQQEIDNKIAETQRQQTQELDREYAEFLRLKAKFDRKEQ